MSRRLFSRAAIVAVGAALALAGSATAVTRAPTTVTIHGQHGDFSGTVSSPQPLHCAAHRTVFLYKQKGNVQNPAQDQRVGMDTTELHNGKYEWDTGNSGVLGKVYARAPQTPKCQADSSKTITST